MHCFLLRNNNISLKKFNLQKYSIDIFYFHPHSTMKYLFNGFFYFTSNFQIKLASYSNVLILGVEGGERRRRKKGEQLKILKIYIFLSLNVIYDF